MQTLNTRSMKLIKWKDLSDRKEEIILRIRNKHKQKNNHGQNTEVWCLELFLEIPIKLPFLWAIWHLLSGLHWGAVARGVPAPMSSEVSHLPTCLWTPEGKEWHQHAYVTQQGHDLELDPHDLYYTANTQVAWAGGFTLRGLCFPFPR